MVAATARSPGRAGGRGLNRLNLLPSSRLTDSLKGGPACTAPLENIKPRQKAFGGKALYSGEAETNHEPLAKVFRYGSLIPCFSGTGGRGQILGVETEKTARDGIAVKGTA